MSIRISALETPLVERLQNGGPDANGHKPERHICQGGGMMPCRHCLTDIEAGEPYLILAHRPFPQAQPYAEQGPIFLHAGSCARHPDSADLPALFLMRAGYLIRGYGADDRIVYGTGKIVAPTAMAEAAEDMFADARVAYIHVRSASNNCYQARIDRA
jgi:Protein of unknown function (DUF1203)